MIGGITVVSVRVVAGPSHFGARFSLFRSQTLGQGTRIFLSLPLQPSQTCSLGVFSWLDVPDYVFKLVDSGIPQTPDLSPTGCLFLLPFKKVLNMSKRKFDEFESVR